MITEFGMSERFRNITLPSTTSQGFGGTREYSESTQEYIDNETAKIVNNRYQLVMKRLQDNKETLEKIAQKLLEKEVLNGDEFESLAQNLVIA
jgi:cell division protease FtsH